jgi:hypothetical protein
MDAATDWAVRGGRYALDFDGTNDHVLITDARLPTLGVSAVFSASVWLYLATLPSGRREIMPTPAINSGQFGAQLEIDGGRLRIRADNGGVASYSFIDALQVTEGQWVHVGGTWNGPERIATLYKNGKAIGTANYAANVASEVSQTRWLFGALQFGASVFFYLQGAIAEAILYGSLLSPNTMAKLHSIGPSVIFSPRHRRFYSFAGPTFNAAWARGSNQFIQPSLIGVA